MRSPIVAPVRRTACWPRVGSTRRSVSRSVSKRLQRSLRGVRVRDVMEHAGVSPDASGALITGLDGFVAYQSIDDLRRSESLFAVDLGVDTDDLAPLPIDHGFPCRIMTPGLYGYMQPKWIDTVHFVDHGGYQSVISKSIPYFEGKIQLALRNPLDREAPATTGIKPAALLGTAPESVALLLDQEVTYDCGKEGDRQQRRQREGNQVCPSSLTEPPLAILAFHSFSVRASLVTIRQESPFPSIMPLPVMAMFCRLVPETGD